MPARGRGGGAWKRTGRLNGSDAGRKAKPVWLCAWCLCWHDDRDAKGKLIRPIECKFCHRDQFDYFHSSGEAGAWGKLHLRQRAGEIRALRRQIPMQLVTVNQINRLECNWAEIILDFGWEEIGSDGNWSPVWADYKPVEGPSPDAALKLRCLEAMGTRVILMTKDGEV